MNLRTPTELLAEIKAATKLGEIGLAKRLGVSQPTVNRILRGQENCSSKALLAIQRVHAEVTAEGEQATSPEQAAA
jgi:DNA-binding transcriptional regulator YdaS (Cro superfamily)